MEWTRKSDSRMVLVDAGKRKAVGVGGEEKEEGVEHHLTGSKKYLAAH